MENLVCKLLNLFSGNVRMKSVCIGLVLLFAATSAHAAGPAGMDTFDNVINTIALWLGRIGLVVAFFGGVQLALGFRNDDAEGKIRGMKTTAAGFLVFGITQTLSLFGL